MKNGGKHKDDVLEEKRSILNRKGNWGKYLAEKWREESIGSGVGNSFDT